MVDGELVRLREEIARADRSISRAIERRLGIALRLGEAKRARHLPVRDYAVEREVVARWQAAMAGPRVAPERAEQLARWLVEESVRVQEELGEARRVRKTGSNILVVGGAGAMGRWLSDFFRSGGHEVAIFDPKARKAMASPYRVHRRLGPAVRWADIIVVATPMGSTKAIYREITAAGGGAILVDILSIKAPILPEIRRARARGWRVSSVHPLFGPSTRTLSDRNLLVLDCGDQEANVAVTDLFRRSSLTITELPIEEHDELMGTVLGLPHVVSLLFSTAASRGGRTGGELAKLSPTSFLREAEVARVVSNENPQLAFDIQSLNPASAAVYSRLGSALEEVRRAAKSRDRGAYQRLLSSARELWNGPGTTH
jgi:chorismate mutase/prephenate dehydrogenase